MDLDGDGNTDLLSGSWPGELFFFARRPDGSFAPPEMLKDKEGHYIDIGGGISETPSELLITGNGEFKEKDGGYVVLYHGEEIKPKPGQQLATTGTAASVHAVDWDRDGDFDLLIGDIGGSVWLIPNEGNAKAWSFGKEQHLQADGNDLHVEGDAGPFCVDWDADGDLDLLVGDGSGKVSYFQNVGKQGKPSLAAAVVLVAEGEVHYDASAPSEPTRGSRAKVCAADWNGDGQLDLLLGDFATQKPEPIALTPEQIAENAVLRKELDELQEKSSRLSSLLYGDQRASKTPEELTKLEAENGELHQRISELRQKLPPEYDDHGWVWLFVRAPKKVAAGE